jgi:hypothetical protein
MEGGSSPLRKFSTFLPQFTRGVEEGKWGEYCILAGTIQYFQPLYAKWMTWELPIVRRDSRITNSEAVNIQGSVC